MFLMKNKVCGYSPVDLFEQCTFGIVAIFFKQYLHIQMHVLNPKTCCCLRFFLSIKGLKIPVAVNPKSTFHFIMVRIRC